MENINNYTAYNLILELADGYLNVSQFLTDFLEEKMTEDGGYEEVFEYLHELFFFNIKGEKLDKLVKIFEKNDFNSSLVSFNLYYILKSGFLNKDEILDNLNLDKPIDFIDEKLTYDFDSEEEFFEKIKDEYFLRDFLLKATMDYKIRLYQAKIDDEFNKIVKGLS